MQWPDPVATRTAIHGFQRNRPHRSCRSQGTPFGRQRPQGSLAVESVVVKRHLTVARGRENVNQGTQWRLTVAQTEE